MTRQYVVGLRTKLFWSGIGFCSYGNKILGFITKKSSWTVLCLLTRIRPAAVAWNESWHPLLSDYFGVQAVKLLFILLFCDTALTPCVGYVTRHWLISNARFVKASCSHVCSPLTEQFYASLRCDPHRDVIWQTSSRFVVSIRMRGTLIKFVMTNCH
jgi:hypothetical protein